VPGYRWLGFGSGFGRPNEPEPYFVGVVAMFAGSATGWRSALRPSSVLMRRISAWAASSSAYWAASVASS
jgi:hypothetical protein